MLSVKQDIDYDGSLYPLYITWWSNNCPIINEHVGANSAAQYVTMATVQPAKNTLNLSFKHL